ncbi:MAG: hypothetical protein H6733_05220 [Alphaproteobacteria bacterium]|nr:hypothetical protein [Alphaproteobacteria bacterium]
MEPPRRAHLLGVALVAAVVRLSVVLHPIHGAIDVEEGATPAAALMLLWRGFGTLWHYRYTGVCGGCTLGTLAAAPVFAAVGPTVLAWKALLLAFPVTLACAAWTVGWRRDGLGGAVLLTAAVVLPPALGDAMLLRGWLNHAESTCLALAAVALATTATGVHRTLAAGLLAGLAIAVGLTGVVTVAALLLVLVVERAWRQAAAFAAGASWCALTWIAAWWGGVDPFDLQTRLAWAWTDRDVGTRLAELVEGVRLDHVFGLGPWVLPGSGVPLLVAFAVAAVLVARGGDRLGRTALVAWVGWLAVLVAGPAELHASRPPYVAHDRYLVVLSLLTPVVVAEGGRVAWRQGRRGLGAGLAAAVLAVGVGTVAVRLAGPKVPVIALQEPVVWPWLAVVEVKHGLPTVPWRCGDDPRCASVRDVSAGARVGPADLVDAPDDVVDTRAWRMGVAAGVGAWLPPLAGTATVDDTWQALRPLPGVDDAMWAMALSTRRGLETAVAAVGAGDGLTAARRRQLGWAWGIRHGVRLDVRAPECPNPDPDFGVGWARAQGQLDGARWGGGFTAVGVATWEPAMRTAYAGGVADAREGGARWVPTLDAGR